MTFVSVIEVHVRFCRRAGACSRRLFAVGVCGGRGDPSPTDRIVRFSDRDEVCGGCLYSVALSVGFAATSPKGRGVCVVTMNKIRRMNLYIDTKNVPICPKILTNKQIGATLNLEDHPINTTEARL